jgi:hypothetical protein
LTKKGQFFALLRLFFSRCAASPSKRRLVGQKIACFFSSKPLGCIVTEKIML